MSATLLDLTQTFIASESRESIIPAVPLDFSPRQIWRITDCHAAGYHSAYIAMLVGYSVKLSMVVILYICMWRSNKSRDAAQATNGVLCDEEERAAIESGMQDMTEIDNKGFRYIL